jgi:hypothetical protein
MNYKNFYMYVNKGRESALPRATQALGQLDIDVRAEIRGEKGLWTN